MFEDLKLKYNKFDQVCIKCKSRNVKLLSDFQEEFGSCHTGFFKCNDCGHKFTQYLDESRKKYN